jgi:hypothetical protein
LLVAKGLILPRHVEVIAENRRAGVGGVGQVVECPDLVANPWQGLGKSENYVAF